MFNVYLYTFEVVTYKIYRKGIILLIPDYRFKLTYINNKFHRVFGILQDK
jgi:hypothetical protein